MVDSRIRTGPGGKKSIFNVRNHTYCVILTLWLQTCLAQRRNIDDPAIPYSMARQNKDATLLLSTGRRCLTIGFLANWSGCQCLLLLLQASRSDVVQSEMFFCSPRLYRVCLSHHSPPLSTTCLTILIRVSFIINTLPPAQPLLTECFFVFFYSIACKLSYVKFPGDLKSSTSPSGTSYHATVTEITFFPILYLHGFMLCAASRTVY